MMDSNYDIKVSYIDLIDSQGIDTDGTPFFYDLYLDLVVYPDGEIIVDDKEELDQSFQTGNISSNQYHRTLSVSNELLTGILADKEVFKLFIKDRMNDLFQKWIQSCNN